MTSKRQTGHEVESLALRYLENQGVKLIERNFYGPHGELDLIVQDKLDTVFVEVRYRRSNRFGHPEETVGRQKQEKIIKTAEYFLLKRPNFANKPSRFDMIAVSGNLANAEINWIKNAFEAVHY